MEDYELKYYLRAGEIAFKALKKALEVVHEDMPIKKLCDMVEETIRSLGGEPAFPCNVSMDNIAAHYTALADDEATIPKGSLVKIDVGAHVDGYIGDVAATVAFDDVWRPLVEAVKSSLKNVVKMIEPGVSMAKLGGVIERSIKAYGFKPVRNLTGHSLSRFNLHAGECIPNIGAGGGFVKDGAAYAVEPFATNGEGYVVDSKLSVIYRYIGLKKVKDRILKEFLDKVWRRFNGLPFTERWLTEEYSLIELRKILKSLEEVRALYFYPVLIEGSGGIVGQFECTVVISGGEKIITTPLEIVELC